MINTPLTRKEMESLTKGSWNAKHPNRKFRRGVMKMNSDLRFFKKMKDNYKLENRSLYCAYRHKEAVLSRRMKNKQIPII